MQGFSKAEASKHLSGVRCELGLCFFNIAKLTPDNDLKHYFSAARQFYLGLARVHESDEQIKKFLDFNFRFIQNILIKDWSVHRSSFAQYFIKGNSEALLGDLFRQGLHLMEHPSKEGAPVMAIQCFMIVASYDKKRADPMHNLGLIYRKLKEVQKAKDWFGRGER